MTVSETEEKEGSYIVNIEANKYGGICLREGYIVLNFRDEQIIITFIQYPKFLPIEDSKFRKFLLEIYDKDGDRKLSQKEANKITYILIPVLGTHTLDGIQYMPYLTEITCCDNQLNSLDVSKNSALTNFCCSKNRFNNNDSKGFILVLVLILLPIIFSIFMSFFLGGSRLAVW